MGYIKRHRVTLSVTASGGASQAFYSDFIHGGGLLEAIHYRNNTASGISTNAHITITGEISAVTMLSVSATGEFTRYPRPMAQDVSGVALTQPVKIPVASERVKVEISSGGTASNGGLGAVVDLYISGV